MTEIKGEDGDKTGRFSGMSILAVPIADIEWHTVAVGITQITNLGLKTLSRALDDEDCVIVFFMMRVIFEWLWHCEITSGGSTDRRLYETGFGSIGQECGLTYFGYAVQEGIPYRTKLFGKTMKTIKQANHSYVWIQSRSNSLMTKCGL